jgi:quinol-cytochrome oxidoreductase complex cytochrome b subunit
MKAPAGGETERGVWKRIRDSQMWKSVFRIGLPKDTRGRLQVVLHNFFLHLHPVRVAKSGIRMTYTFCLGGISAFLFIVLTVTGVFLMFYYVPDTGRAYADMKDIGFVVPFGRVMRAMHRWAAHLMVVTVILHMARVFLTGSYKPPREFNWVIGVCLLVLTLLLSFTGYLLPWDQLAYWAITVGTNMAAAVPVFGHDGPLHQLAGMTVENDVRFVLLGDVEVGATALIRFYVLHCVGLPLAALVLMAVHFWRVRKDGGISRPL